MPKSKESTIEEKLRALYNLQLIDTRIDEIKNVRGELPLEVEDLDAEIAGLEKRLSNINIEVEAFSDEIKNKKHSIDVANDLIKKYNDQQKNVRNNRAYESLNKEIEFQELEIELAEKQIKQLSELIEQKNESINDTSEKIEERKNHLEHKKSELDSIMAETQKEEDILLKKSNEYAVKVDERLVSAYKRIRKSVKNGLAIVSVDRGASAGSFFTIPPQIQLEIASRKKIITDEHSGRILVDKDLAKEQEEFMSNIFSSAF